MLKPVFDENKGWVPYAHAWEEYGAWLITEIKKLNPNWKEPIPAVKALEAQTKTTILVTGNDYEKLCILVVNKIAVGKRGATANELVDNYQKFGSWTRKQWDFAGILVHDIITSVRVITNLKEAAEAKSGSEKALELVEDLDRGFNEWGSLTKKQLELAEKLTAEFLGQGTFWDREQF